MENTKACETRVLKIEVGKAYRTRAGGRVDIFEMTRDATWPFRGRTGDSETLSWRENGIYGNDSGCPLDIVAPWEDEKPAVDLTKANAGDIALLKCGGRVTLGNVETSIAHKGALYIKFDDCDHGMHYASNGHAMSAQGRGPVESYASIVAIEPKPFDWTTVKPGMAFMRHCEDDYRKLLFYVGPAPLSRDPEISVFYDQYEGAYGVFGKHLVRSRPHDIPPPAKADA